MQLTPATFSNLDENLDIRQLAAMRATSGTCFGRLANTEFCVEGVFVQGVFEVPQFKCFAILPSGCLINPDEPVSVRFPRLTDGYAYLTVSLGNEMVEYEKEGVPYVRQAYNYEILPENEMLRQNASMPVVRFCIENARCTIDRDFIPPCLQFDADDRLVAWRDTFAEMIETLARHSNMKEGDGQQTLLRYMFRLRSFNLRHNLNDFLLLISEMVQAVRYFIVLSNNAEDRQIDEVSCYDVSLWFNKVKEYLIDASRVLDGVVLVDESIDFEALKAQLKSEIYAMLQPEMQAHIDQSVQALRDDLNQKLSDALRDYIDGTFRRELEEGLSVSISEALRQDLYDKLYRALYDALFVPQTQEDDNFMPLI